jgi:four helix bundle protein
MTIYKDVIAWRVGYAVAVAVCRLTRSFPKDEQYGLASQMRRSAVSIPSNIAEGFHRKTRADYAQFCHIAYGSAAELETQLSIAKDLNYAVEEQIAPIENELSRCLCLLSRLCQALKRE